MRTAAAEAAVVTVAQPDVVGQGGILRRDQTGAAQGEQCGPGPIAEEARGPAVGVVDDSAQHLGADDEHSPSPPGLELRRR